jgi:hypothetical protein
MMTAKMGVEVTFKVADWVNEEFEPPKGYQRLPAGCPFTTRSAKKRTMQSGRTAFVEKRMRGGYMRAVACWVPRDVLRDVRRAEVETRAQRAATREASRRSRARRHESDLKRLAARLAELYPGLPDPMEVVGHAFEIGSERVGRTSKLEEDRRLELAVIAHARHRNTSYDRLFDLVYDREEARQIVRGEVDEIVSNWKTGEEVAKPD